jgi:predicted transcriptional regulator
MKSKSFTYYMFWAVFLGLLATMLPHTQWAFRQLEPAISPVIYGGFTYADLVALAAAFSFEAGLAVFVHRLSRKIEKTKKVYRGVGESRAVDYWATLGARYVNMFTAGVLFCAFVSGMANYFHALQFSTALVAFSKVGFFRELYPLALGAALPIVSLIFASALSNVSEEETEEDPANVELKEKNKELNRSNRELSQAFSKLQADFSALQEKFSTALAEVQAAKDSLKVALGLSSDQESELKQATEELKATNELVNSLQDRLKDNNMSTILSGMEPKERIVYLKQTFSELPNASIAIMAGVSPGRVSQVLKDASMEGIAGYAVSFEPIQKEQVKQ